MERSLFGNKIGYFVILDLKKIWGVEDWKKFFGVTKKLEKIWGVWVA